MQDLCIHTYIYIYIINCRYNKNYLATRLIEFTKILNITPSMISVSPAELLDLLCFFLLPDMVRYRLEKQWSFNGTHLGGIKQYKSMVLFRDFPYYNTLFGLVI